MDRILIVDDNECKREALKESLERLFPEAEVAEFECQMDFLCTIRYDHWREINDKPERWLLVIDMQMPFRKSEMIDVNGGFSALRWLCQVDVRCPAIIASSEPIDEEWAREAYGYFKGFVQYQPFVSPIGVLRELLSEYLVPPAPDRG